MMNTCLWTRAANEAAVIVEEACARRTVALLLGASGSGKSVFARTLAASGSSRILFYEAETPNTPRSLLRALQASLLTDGIIAPRSSRHTAIDCFISVMNSLRISQVTAIIVDEAHRLTQPTCETLRRLHEHGNIAIILCGPSRLVPLLLDRCPELLARVQLRHEMTGVGADEVFSLLLNASKNKRSRKETLFEAARLLEVESGGNFLQLLPLIECARKLARRQRRGIEPRFVRRAISA